MSQFKYFHELPARRRALRRGHRPGHVARRARPRARLPARVRERPRHRRPLLGAVVLRARAGGADRASTSGAVLEAAEVGGGQLPAARRATPACGSAIALGELAPQRARQAHVRGRRAAVRRSASGPSSSSPSRPASRAAASCRSPTSRWSTRTPTAPDRVFLHIARRRRASNAAQGRPRCARPGHPTITVRADGPGRPRADLLPLRVRHRGRRLGAGDQPVRPAQRAGGQGQHGQGARRGRRRTSTRASLDELLARARAAALPGDHRLPAVQRRDRRRGRARCARG